MSFSVRAGNSPRSQKSPVSQPYVSPQVVSQSTYRTSVPSFSLPASENVAGNNGGGAPAKKVGTNPTRYKTTMCRNWEAGTCTFKGCTFAHGVEELRSPSCVDHYGGPIVHSRGASAGKASPQYSAATALAGSLSPPRIEQLMEMLYTEVIRERDLVTVHVEANRTLEALLKKEKTLHDETKAQLEAERLKVNELTHEVLRTSEEINTFLESCKVNAKQRNRIALLLNKLAFVVPEGDRMEKKAVGEDSRVEELLKALQQCQKPADV